MSEEEIIKEIEYQKAFGTSGILPRWAVIDGLLNLYNKEKEKNKLLKTYKGNLSDNVEMICLCKDDFERNISNDYISKDKIKEIIYPTPEHPIPLEVQMSRVYNEIINLLEE